MEEDRDSLENAYHQLKKDKYKWKKIELITYFYEHIIITTVSFCLEFAGK